MARPPNSFPFMLLLMWGTLGAVAGCCVLWVLVSVGDELREFISRYSEFVLSKLGFRHNFFTEFVFLHLQFAGLGFVCGGVFRFVGLRKRFPIYHGDASKQ
jgi:hypothetical protein